MIRLYDNAFSPFARKVRIVLEHKGLAHDLVDGLALPNRQLLEKVNGRVEVPALDHDGLVVVGSSDIVAYLERIAPERPVHPREHSRFVQARAWERCADTFVDAVVVDLSYWTWAERSDTRPDAWVEAGRRDLDHVYVALERDLEGHDFICGAEVSIADIALFPHLASTKLLGVSYDADRYPRLHAWLKRLRAMPIFAADLARAKAYVGAIFAGQTPAIERRKLFWRGDRIEWLLANGFHGWLFNEIKEGRVLWPGPGVPGPLVTSEK